MNLLPDKCCKPVKIAFAKPSPRRMHSLPIRHLGAASLQHARSCMRCCWKVLAYPEAMPRSLCLFPLASLLAIQWILAPTAQAQEPPTKQFEQRDVPLSLIFSEWRQNGNNANTYICTCDREICDTRPGWPFRSFRTGQSIPALGEANLNDARRDGFICGRR